MRARQAIAAVPKYATRRGSRRRTWGGDIAEYGAALGFPLMPWQRDFVDVAGEYRVRDQVPYRKVALCTVPRQSGKSIVTEAVAAWALLSRPDQYGIITAQTRIAGTNRLRHLANHLLKSGLDPDHTFTRGVGSERIICSNGSRLDVVAPSQKSVHGEAVDFAIIDEAWAVEAIFLAGVVPAMVARPRSQLWVISTAGDQTSELLNDLVAAARDDPQGGTAFLEYSMPDDANPYDSARWAEWMPALGYTTSYESIQAAANVLSLPEFRRAFGNIPILESNAAAIPWSWWADTVAAPPAEMGLSIGVDVNRNPPGWSISAAWPTESGYHLDLVEHGATLELSQIPHRVEDLVRRFNPSALGLDPAGPGGALLPDFQSLAQNYGVPLELFNGGDRARADVHLFELLAAGTLTHSSMMALDQAVEGARAEEKGNAWYFSRPSSYVDISPLCAASMALWCAYRYDRLAPVVAIY